MLRLLHDLFGNILIILVKPHQHAGCKSNSTRYELIQPLWRNYNFCTKTQSVYIERQKTT